MISVLPPSPPGHEGHGKFVWVPNTPDLDDNLDVENDAVNVIANMEAIDDNNDEHEHEIENENTLYSRASRSRQTNNPWRMNLMKHEYLFTLTFKFLLASNNAIAGPSTLILWFL